MKFHLLNHNLVELRITQILEILNFNNRDYLILSILRNLKENKVDLMMQENKNYLRVYKGKLIFKYLRINSTRSLGTQQSCIRLIK